jgi:hypothetical protein
MELLEDLTYVYYYLSVIKTYINHFIFKNLFFIQTTVTYAGKFMLASQVKCPLMISDLGTYVLTISNDGITESDSITIVLYTSACKECTGLVCVDKVGTVALNTIKQTNYKGVFAVIVLIVQ